MSEPVVVIGAGPTGLLLATELALAGAETVVLDRLAEPSPRAPGQAINVSTVEILDQRGLADALRDKSIPLPAAHYSLIWLAPDRLDSPEDRHDSSLIIAQSAVEARLAERASELGVEIRRGHELTGLAQDDDGVDLRISGPGGAYRLRASHAVGADGDNSTTRRLAGIGLPGSEWSFSGVVADVRLDFGTLAAEHFGARYADTGGMYSGVPVGSDILRVIVTEFRDPDAADEPVGDGELAASVELLTGSPLPSHEVVWADRFASRSGNAEKYRSGRVFLVGDAAHTFFPLGGLRIGTSIQDAANLGWKLAAEVAGWAPPGLLDTYEQERQPEGERARIASDAQLGLAHPPNRVAGIRAVLTELAAEHPDVNRRLVRQVTGVDVRYAFAHTGVADHPLLGSRLPLVPEIQRLLHDGGGLLVDFSSGAVPVGAAAAYSGRIRVAALDRVPGVDAEALLLRPDGHVAWVWSEGSDDLPAALKAWFGEPGPGAADSSPGN